MCLLTRIFKFLLPAGKFGKVVPGTWVPGTPYICGKRTQLRQPRQPPTYLCLCIPVGDTIHSSHIHSFFISTLTLTVIMVSSTAIATASAKSLLLVAVLFCMTGLVLAEEQVCLEDGVECTPLAGECCDGSECVANVNILTFSAELSCGAAYEPCAVCGDGLVVGSPDADTDLPLAGFSFTCGELEQAGQLGLFDTSLCGFVPDLIFDSCNCIPPASEIPSDMPSMAPSMTSSSDIGDGSSSPVPTDMPGPGPDPTFEPTMSPTSGANVAVLLPLAMSMMMSMLVATAVAASF